MTIPRERWPYIAQALAVATLFGPTLFLGEVPYFRDVVYTYYPDLVFLERSLRSGVFPLWHPGADGGAPFFAPYPPHLLLALAFGATWTLRLSVVLHVWLAAAGATALARHLGAHGRLGAAELRLRRSPHGTGDGLRPAPEPDLSAFVAGVAFGLSGVVLSSLLYPVFLAAAWMPWVVLAWTRLHEQPSPRAAAALAAVAAVQISTFGGEVCVQTALLAVVLCPPRRTALRALALAGLSFVALASPVVLGARALMADTARAAGFSPAAALAYSAAPSVLLESLLPGFLGDLRGFSGAQLWGEALHPNGFPFFVSLYQGPLVLLLAAFGRSRRLWALAALGVVLALGAHGPAGPLLAQVALFRAPVKFMFLTALALALLAGAGLERARGRGPMALALVLAVPLAVVGGLAAVDPRALAAGLAPLFPGLGVPHAPAVLAAHWPPDLSRAALLVALAGLALAAGRGAAVPLLLVVELFAANVRLVPSAPAAVLALRPEVSALLEPVRQEPPARLFSCGLCATPALNWRGRPRTDLTLYALERQALAPRAQVIDGLDGAFDEDRMGLAPAGSTLPARLRDPTQLPAYFRALTLGNVRWMLSWRPLPAALATPRGEVALPEVVDPLRLYELRGALPRAYWVPAAIAVADRRGAWEAVRQANERAVVVVEVAAVPAAAGDGPTAVEYRPEGPHGVRVRARTPPGFLVVVDGFAAGWQLAAATGPVPLWRANGRYRAWWTPGGEQEFNLTYAPGWRGPALAGLGLGLLGLLVSALTGRLDRSRVDA